MTNVTGISRFVLEWDEKIVGKGENAGYQHFLLFLQCFLPSHKQISIMSYIYFLVCICFQFGPVQNFVLW